MSNITLNANAGGTGIFTIASPSSNTNRTLTLPDATTTIAGTDATQTLTNKTLGTGLVMGASAITAATAQASTSGTSIDFTGIPSWVRRVTVAFSEVSTNGLSIVQIQLGAGSVQTSGYRGSVDTTATTVGCQNISTGLGLERTGGAGATNSRNGFATFVLLGSNIWAGTALIGYLQPQISLAACTVTLGGTLDRVRITTVNGTDTFDAGSINILYE
jgi:hypothetical protein